MFSNTWLEINITKISVSNSMYLKLLKMKPSYLRKLFMFFLFLLFSSVPGLKAATDTTTILENLKAINQELNANIDSVKPLILETISESKGLSFTKGIARSYLALTQYYIFKGQPDSAKLVIPELEKVLVKSKDKTLNISILLKIAIILSDLGDFKGAVEKAIEAQKAAEGTSDYRLLAKINHDLGLINARRQLLQNALEYYRKGLSYALLSKDTFSIANLYVRIGGVHNDMALPDSGIHYNLLGLKYFKSINMKRGIGIVYNNIAGSYELKEDYNKAIEFYNKALPIRQELGDENGITILYYNMGSCFLYMNKLELAEKYLLDALKRTKEEKDYSLVLETLKRLTELYSKKENFNEFRLYADEYIDLKDSITEANNVKAIYELQQQYESEKKEKDILMLTKENEKKEALNRSQRKSRLVIIISALIIVFLLSLFAFILYKRIDLIKKQKRLIESQKEKVEEQKKVTELQKNVIEAKQKEIVDSINYAKHLQQAILATPVEIRETLADSFLLYRPKDIVAGDFYFFEETDTHIFLAAADCTGHGVPGALVSVICCNALTRCVKEFKLVRPADILDKARELVLTTFKKSRQDIRDGMDISLLSINKIDKRIYWAGANNPLWYIAGESLREIKGDKQPIGFSENFFSFTNHEVPDSATYYLFTDGYADQFGGPKGKKFKYAQLKELFSKIHHLDMLTQSSALTKRFEEWKSDYEQVDDVCIIGVRV